MIRAGFTLLMLAVALPAGAQQLTLEIHDGLVNLSAVGVPARLVLAEWARVGGTRVVGAERVGGTPLTLNLEAMPEAKALDIILRGAAGYVAAVRSSPGSGGSVFDRILVMATTSTPPQSRATTAAPGNLTAGGRVSVPAIVEPVAPPDVPEELPEADAQVVTNPFAAAAADAATSMALDVPAPSIPFGLPVPKPGQPFLQDESFFKQLPPADNYDPSLLGARPRPQR